MKELEDALAAIRRGDDLAARRALIAAWRARRTASLAALVERIDERSPDEVPDTLRAIARTKLSLRTQRLADVADLDDPRVSAWALDVLDDPPFASHVTEAYLTAIIAVAARDPRLRDRRAAIVASLLACLEHRGMRKRLVAKVEAAVHALPAIAEASAANAALEADIARQLEPLGARKRTEAALLADIYANPDDDAPRQVYADMLLERGDPHGELIRLQLERRPGGAVTERERRLLVEHGKSFLGPLAPVLEFGGRHKRTRLERGFVARAQLRRGALKQDVAAWRRLEQVIDSPAWGTVEVLADSPWTFQMLRRAPLHGLRTIEHWFLAADLIAIAQRTSPLARVERLHVTGAGLADAVPASVIRRLFPALTTLDVFYQYNQPISVAELSALAGYGAPRMVVERYVLGELAEYQAHHEAVVTELLGCRAFVDSLALKPPALIHERPRLVELRRGPDGKFARA